MSASRRSLELEGVILGHRDFSDSHRIVDVLTGSEGRLSLLARGGRASKKRFAGALDLFTTLRLQVSAGGNLWALSSADILNARMGIRADLDRLARASLLVELARTLAPEHQAAPNLLAVLSDALDRVDRGELASAAAGFPALLSAGGVLPDVTLCVQCGARDREGQVLDIGFVCEGCRPFRQIMKREVRAAWAGAPCNDTEVASAVEDSVLDYAEATLGARFKSRHLKL
ncbi:MAG: DNA repair protein RecO [Myxococcota bacterium]